MRLVIAFFVTLMFEGTALAQATSPSAIRVTQRPLSQSVVPRPAAGAMELGPPPECGVLNPPHSGARTLSSTDLMAEQRRMADSWKRAGLKPGRGFYCGVVPSVSDSTPLNQFSKLTYQQQMQAAKRGFAAWDHNHDGVISRREWSVSEARATALAPERNRAQFKCQIDQEFKLLDSNHDGEITFAEFIADNFGKDRQPIRGCY